MRVEQHFVGLEKIGANEKGPAIRQLHVSDLQLDPLIANERPSPALSARFSASRTVERGAPSRREISCAETDSDLRRIISRAWRIVIRSAGIDRSSLDCQRSDLIRPTAAPATARNYPGGIIPLQGGGIISESGGAIIPF